MRKLTQALLLAGVVGVPSFVVATPVLAEEAAASPIAANVTLASEYVYRGISQTREKLALQGGFDYAHSSGLYAGVWGSNVSWIDDLDVPGLSSSSMELDLYAGYKGKISDDFGYDVGYLRYEYPASYPADFTKPNTDELYVAGSYKMFTLKYSHSISNLFGATDSKGSGYLDASANFELMSGLTLGLHAGHQKIKNHADLSYTDYKVSLTKDFGGGLSVTGAYIDTNADDALYTVKDTKIADSRFVLSVTKAF